MDDSGGVLTIPMQPMQPPQGFQTFQRPNARTFQRRGPPSDAKGGAQDGDTSTGPVMFDGKRMRKAVHRKTVDYNSAVVQYLENRVWQRDYRDMRAIQPDSLYQIDIPPPIAMINNSMNCVTTKFIRASTNKFRCPIFCLAWTPEGRRLVTGASSGEFTLWNGLTFNFETILQAHDTSCRAMQWSHNDNWMVTADHFGYIKYWQSNMNNVKMYQGHKEPIRGIRYQHLHMDLLSSRIHGNSVHLFLCGYVPSRATALRCSNELHHSGSSHCEVTKCLVMGIFPVTCVLCHLEVLIIQCSRLSALLNVLLVLYLINQADSREVTGKISYFVIGG